MVKYSVIGGSGFVGTNFCRRLAVSQKDFEIIDLKPSNEFPGKFKFGDVRDIESLRSTISGDIVVLLAAVHRDDVRDPNEYTKTNVFGAENVATVCSEKGISKIVFTSSVAVYGFATPGTGESGELKPFNQYGVSKMQAETKLQEWQTATNGQLAIVRPTVIFGEGNRGNVYNLLEAIARNRFLMIGDGTNTKSLAYIGNVVEFLDKCCASNQQYAIYNYVDTPDLSMNELVTFARKELGYDDRDLFRLPLWAGICIGKIADFLSSVLGTKSKISEIRVRKFAATTAFSSAKDALDGFEAPFALKSGLQDTLEGEFLNPDPKREVFYTE